MSVRPHNQRLRSPPKARARRRALGPRLDALVAQVDRAALVAGDPVELVHRYPDPHDQEVAGLVVAALAYGRVASIRAAAEAALGPLGARPAEALAGGAGEALDGFVYRFQRGDDLPRFLGAVAAVRRRHGSLGAAFEARLEPGAADVASAATAWVAELRAEMGPLTYGLRYLIPDPGTGGAAKRLWLYLRWMVRGPDGLDLGAWRALAPRVPPSGLVVPLDTHVARIARYLGLTARRTNDLAAARAITRALARLDPDDPVRYDMALCHLGISGSCPRRLDLAACARCPVASACGRRR